MDDIEYEQIWDGEVQTLYDEAMESGILQKDDFAYLNSLPFRYYLVHGGHKESSSQSALSGADSQRQHKDHCGRQNRVCRSDSTRRYSRSMHLYGHGPGNGRRLRYKKVFRRGM